MVETIKIKYMNENCVVEQHGDWIDLKAAKDYSYETGDTVMIDLGVAMELPNGYEAHVLPRSSTFKKYGIFMVNGMGIIDEDYCGDNDWWKMQCIAIDDGQIEAGDRVAQFRIVKKQPKINFDTVLFLGNDDRGGIGSTGV